MKKIIISTFPPRKCGIGIYTKHIADELKDAEIISLKEHTYSDKRAKPMIDGKLGSFLKASKYLKTNGYKSVLIEHEYAFYNPLFFLIFLLDLKINGIRANIELHTIADYNDFIKKNIFRLYNFCMILLANRTIVHTNYAKRRLLGSALFKNKIEIIPLGIPAIPLAVPKARKLEKMRGKELKLLCFGFIWYDKGTDIAVKAFGSAPNIKLKIVGSINPSATEKQIIFFDRVKRLAAGHKNITVIDIFVTEEEKMKLYAEADFIVMPYRMISQSAVLTEIWSAGKIPIASDLEPLKEEIGRNEYGMLFQSGNAEDLKNAVFRIAKNTNMQQKIRRNIELLAIRKRSFNETAKLLFRETA